ncbi:MAG: polysaccharide biosynthesis C-terminal domain-containing protein, partial [Bacteroidia bacterium]
NISDLAIAQKITINMVKISFIGSLVAILILLLIPIDLYAFIFGQAFREVKTVIWFLSPGILFLAVSTVFTHYFSGLGKNHINSIASGIGLFFTLILCYLLIPVYGLAGAAAATSISYASSLFYLIYKFVFQQNISISSFYVNKKDIKILIAFIKK